MSAFLRHSNSVYSVDWCSVVTAFMSRLVRGNYAKSGNRQAEKYSHSMREVWNEFNRHAKNGIFLFDRDFMEYHSDRFMDHSLMFRDGDGRMVAEMPAHVDGATIYSHNGLTFGGMISGFDMTTEGMLSVFSSMNEYLLGQGIDKLVYKALPTSITLLPRKRTCMPSTGLVPG